MYQYMRRTEMSKKIINLQIDMIVFCGLFFAIRLIYTKEIFIQVYGYTINTLNLLILTIVLVVICRVTVEEWMKVKSNKNS